MAGNPFRYGSPVSAPHFAGRVAELDALVDRMENGINVVVTAPRRFGKTSLLNEGAGRVLTAVGCVVRANLLRTPSLDALASRLTSEAYHLPGGAWRRAAQAVPEFLSRLRFRPTVAFDDSGHPVFTFSGGVTAPAASQLLEDVYQLLDEMAHRHPAVLMLDEFQAITDLDGSLPRLLKALADQYPAVSLVMAGSKQHLMEALVLSNGAPLYHMAERIALGPIEEDVMVRFLRNRARAGHKPMTAAAARGICELAGPIPYDIQRLAYEVYAGVGDSIDVDVVDSALERVVAHEDEAHAERFSTLAVGQRRVLVVLAQRGGVERPQSSELARATGYANPAGVAKAMAALVDDEIVIERGGTYEVADPFFRAWLRIGQ
ncbi:MAG TPA: hypothetical protein VMB82_02435 [Acidimicrobiales bacterium]|nr:hypothetical protein [Acidimicrobiales bacterium]